MVGPNPSHCEIYINFSVVILADSSFLLGTKWATRHEIYCELSAYVIAEAAKVMRKYGLIISGYSSNPHSQFFFKYITKF
jgi:hypothetical protein